MLKPYWGTFFLAVVCLALVTVCIVAFTSLVRPIFNQIWSNTNFNISDQPEVTRELKEPEKEDALSLTVKTFNLEEVLPPEFQQVYLLVPILLVVIFLIKGVFSYLGNYLMAAVGHSVVRDIRNNLFNTTVSKPISFFRQRPTGG